ncbi:NepR family anti-sigma factor [Methylobacterium gnaphalii]|uniref:NepR family anti-sigma factor n=1 Tax=Methylobacterium gnaphalii TaxID=1010610 RepID=UPI0011BF413A|nr:hypothetical protein MMMDOFMJ_3359 [Methylobacterium gnaphalii]
MTEDEKAGGLHAGGSLPAAQTPDAVQPLGKHAHRRIGAHLRTMYDSIVQQPIPSRFSDLIAQLDDGPAEASDQG